MTYKYTRTHPHTHTIIIVNEHCVYAVCTFLTLHIAYTLFIIIKKSLLALCELLLSFLMVMLLILLLQIHSDCIVFYFTTLLFYYHYFVFIVAKTCTQDQFRYFFIFPFTYYAYHIRKKSNDNYAHVSFVHYERKFLATQINIKFRMNDFAMKLHSKRLRSLTITLHLYA